MLASRVNRFRRAAYPTEPIFSRAAFRAGARVTNAILDDLLRDRLAVVFVGINPSIFSVQRGHYFARPGNRFWPCLSRSILSGDARAGLAVDRLGPQHDAALLAYGIGFTDVVKRPTARASDVAPAEFAAGVDALLSKLERLRPQVACFHGVTGFVHVQRRICRMTPALVLGPQNTRLGATRLYLVPNPSGANAHVTPAEQVRWYDRLAQYAARPD